MHHAIQQVSAQNQNQTLLDHFCVAVLVMYDKSGIDTHNTLITSCKAMSQ